MEFNHRIAASKVVFRDERDFVVFNTDLRDYARAAGVINILNGTRTRTGDHDQIAAFDSDHWKLLNVIKGAILVLTVYFGWWYYH